MPGRNDHVIISAWRELLLVSVQAVSPPSPLHEPGFLVFMAEGTDIIYDPIHFPKGHTMHLAVQIIKGLFNGLWVFSLAFTIVAI